MPPEHVIKKYANRRLYDAASSRHVTLDDLRRLIVQGERIKVVDDKSGEDITRPVLLQIIAEQEQFGRPILSVPVLEALIRFYGNNMQEFMTRYLEQSVENFLKQQQTAQAQVARLMSGTPFASVTDMARQNFEAWRTMQETVLDAMTGRHHAEPDDTRETQAAEEPKPEGGDSAQAGRKGRRPHRE